MNGWFRDKATYDCYDGSKTITIYKLDGIYDKNPHSPARRQEVVDSMVSTAMVSLVHLYRNSVGGLVDAEARRILNGEFESLEDKRWKWMFARSDEVAGDTAGAVSFSDTAVMPQGASGGQVSANLTAARPGLPGSSKYLLFEQVPVNDAETCTKLIPSYRQSKSKYACHIYAYSDLRDWNAGGTAAAMTSGKRSGMGFGADTSIKMSAIGDDASIAFDPFHAIDFGVTTTGINDSVFRGRTRKCMYQLVAGTPLNGLLERTGDEGFKQDSTRISALKEVSATIPGDGPFNPKRSRQLGSAGVYDGLGRPSSSWFARARFKAFMETVNKKRRLDASEPEYDMSDVNGYIAGTLNRREEIATMYPREERMRDASETVNLAASCLVGEATTDWFVETDPLNGMSFDNRLRLILPPHKLTAEERGQPIDERYNNYAWLSHTYAGDSEDFAYLFPKRNPPANPGHNAEARHAHLARLATNGIRRSKRPGPALVPQRPFERRIYARPGDTEMGVSMLSSDVSDKLHAGVTPRVCVPQNVVEYVGCGFSECVVEPLCRGGVEAADGLVDAVADFVTMFKDTESEFARDAATAFERAAFEDDGYEFVLVPADPDSLPCGEIGIGDDQWMVGATPTALSCAAKLAMDYVVSDGMLCKNVPQTVDEENMMHARDAIEKLATNARYTEDYDASRDGASSLMQMPVSGGMNVPLQQGPTTAGAGTGLATAAAAVLTVAAAVVQYNEYTVIALEKKKNELIESINEEGKGAKAKAELKEELERLNLARTAMVAVCPMDQNDYYSRLYAAVFWVILGMSDDPTKKKVFEKMLKCCHPEVVSTIQFKDAETAANAPKDAVEVPENPGFISSMFSMGVSAITNNPKTALACVALVGGVGLGAAYAYTHFSYAAAVPLIKKGMSMLETPAMTAEVDKEDLKRADYLRGHQAANNAAGNPNTISRDNTIAERTVLYQKRTHEESEIARLLNERRSNHAPGVGQLTQADEHLLAAAQEKMQSEIMPQLEYVNRVLSPETAQAYTTMAGKNQYGAAQKDLAALGAAQLNPAQRAQNDIAQTHTLLQSVAFDERWASHRMQLWNVVTAIASKCTS